MNKSLHSPGSALLLTVMIIAILTTTTLASIAVRFDQLASTDKVANAAVAKSAADSALIKLKEKLATSSTVSPTVEDLDTNQESTLSTTTPFRPNPRKIVATYQKSQTALPRCLAVAVLTPWTNDGQYLMSEQNSSNPALIFNYANIVNDTPLGMVPGNGGLSASDKASTISQLTNMGHFYNPYAPAGSSQSTVSYWTIKLGGPGDQFLTRKGSDNISSYYKNIDFFYLPYLPRWRDSGIFTTTPGTGVDRIDGASLEAKFESTVKSNNFKIWLDASVSNDTLIQYGFGDLFTADSQYRLKWLQPSLWNDSPESDWMTPYQATDANAAPLTWAKKSQPLFTPGANDAGWNTAIIKGAKSFSFIKLSSTQGSTAFSPGAIITGLIYGTMEGLRLNQNTTFQLLGRNQQPLSLVSRGQDQGRLYNVNFTAIGPTSISNGVTTINVTFKLSSSTYDTPQLLTNPINRTAVWGDMDTIAVLAGPQYSTSKSNQSVTINADANGLNATVVLNSTCTLGASLTACPAVGDIVDLTKTGSTPVWGKVTQTNFSANGTTLTSIVLDALHKSPPPTREMAYTSYTASGSPRIAYYGGAVDMNDYDGGYASEINQLWLYDPEADVWTFVTPASGVTPGPRAGASMVYDPVNNRLVMVGGYYHESVVVGAANNCELGQPTCLYTDRPGLRIAKRVTNDVYAYSFASNTWEKEDYSAGWGKIQNGATYTVRVTSSLADRSGLERWKLTGKNPNGANQILNVNGTASNVNIYPSAAGYARGDSLYVYGDKASDGSTFYAWAKVNSVDYNANNVNITVYGYQPANGETQVTLSAVALQDLYRTNFTNTCLGGFDGTYYSCQFNSSGDTTGYAVGDQVVLEQYSAGDAQLTSSLSGFISFIDSAGKAYFVADERSASISDFSDRTVGKVVGDSAVAFPSGRYGATLAAMPTNANQASYWEGAARNLYTTNRFADLWKIQFVTGSGPTSVVWSFQTTDNPIDTAGLNANKGNSYAFQVVRPSYGYQLATTGTAANNPEMIAASTVDPKTGLTVTAWDNAARWVLEISASDAQRLVTGNWMTLERRMSDGTRQTFHGVVEDMYNSPPAACGTYADTKLCLRHNPSFPNDSGLTGNSANTTITVQTSFRTDYISSGIFKADTTNGFVSLSGLSSNDLAQVPTVGAMVQVWNNNGIFPANDYTLMVNSRTFNSATKTFNFYYDKLTASPDPLSFSTSQITSQSGTDRLMTMTDSILGYVYGIAAPEWNKDTSTGAWKIRLSAANPGNIFGRPSNRRGSAVASIYDSVSQSSQTYLMGGATAGQYAAFWREQNSGSTTTNTPAWSLRYPTADGNQDAPSLAGGALVLYKVGATTRAVFLGGKYKVDSSGSDYGRGLGPYIYGRPVDYNPVVNDNSFYIAENSGSAGTDAAAFVNIIQNNLPANRPSGVDPSLEFKAGGLTSGQSVCAYLGQATGCSGGTTSKELLAQLGTLGRLDPTKSSYNGSSWGYSAMFNDLGSAFKQQTVDGKTAPSLILGIPTVSGININGRFDQEGYRPYLADTNLAYGQLATDFGSNKTGGLVAYAAINGGGAILATAVGVGNTVAASRGGSNGTIKGWYSYCAAAETEKNPDGSIKLQADGTYACQNSASRYLSWLPDTEDTLFTLNAALALAATDSYKVVGYYGGVKRGYLVISRTGTAPTVFEIAP